MQNAMHVQKTRLLRFHQFFSFRTILLIMFVSTSASFAITRHSTTTHAASSSFIFTAVGDYANTSATTANLQLIANSGAQFNLALGDFNYDPTLSATQWSTYAKSNLPTNFPFEVLAGNEDTATINTFIANLPNHIGNISGIYGKQYSFDYPASTPLARFIMVSPGGILPGYDYSASGHDYKWLSDQIDGARSTGIPWVIVGMHEFCLAMGPLPCTIGADLENLLVSKKVDLVLQAHNHSYQVSKQLALNSTNCQSMTIGSYNAGCVANASSKLTKGVGSVFVITATGGASLGPLSPTDPEAGYFRKWENQTWGVSRFTVSATQLAMKFVASSGGTFSDSFTITSKGPVPTPTVTPSATASPTPAPSGTVPVNTHWYFAEGRVGAGFKEYLTVGNPTTTTCQVMLRYLYTPDGGTAQTKTLALTIPAQQRLTQAVNADLNIPWTQHPGASTSAILTVDQTATPTCQGIVAERPMYFTALGVTSNSDVLGATHPATSFYFADVATGNQATGGTYSSFIAILNPGTSAATVTATYFAGGQQVGRQQVVVAAGTRGTIFPTSAANLPQHVAALVSSSQPVVVERPTYFSNISAGNAQIVSGAADVVGVPSPATDFLFAEGYTGGQFQENLILANFGSTQTAATVLLEFANGHTQSVPTTIAGQSQTWVNINQVVANHSGTCDVTPCQPTPEVSLEVQAPSPVVAERELFFHYNHTDSLGRTLTVTGGTDVIGQVGPASASAYSFAEGYTNVGYDEWLTLQNPTSQAETITVTLVNELGTTYTFPVTVLAHSRATTDITATVVAHMVHAGENFSAYEVSMLVQSSHGPCVAERPMYSNTGSGGTQGGSDVFGYIGG